MTTRDKLVQAAATLLDRGGEQAVTLRAVGHAAGLSHNAPYKHFRNRDALLAAVATADLATLTRAFADIRSSTQSPGDKLLAALTSLVTFSRKRQARYRLVFSAPALARHDPDLQAQSTACLGQIMIMVEDCKKAGELPDVPTKGLASLFLATMHGLVTMEANGMLQREKGLPTVEENIAMLASLLSR
ncbi:TetR/AcrR family transcriptional regulator [Myxococcus sp. Y35]|uniref:TetR/AcrR family transcriptional regulator n=1 Tax=Pseudomyxococcus flavus TaxID=3115648 RepID=UPI003CEBC93A